MGKSDQIERKKKKKIIITKGHAFQPFNFTQELEKVEEKEKYVTRNCPV